MGFFNSGQSVAEQEMVKVVPKDRWALAERTRREASERALKVANMLADRFVGVVEPVEPPLEPGETPINAGMPVNTGNTRIYVHTEVRGLYDIKQPKDVYSSASDEEMRRMEDSLTQVKVIVHFVYRCFKSSDESFYWEHDYMRSWFNADRDEVEIDKIENDRVVMW